MQQLVLAGFFLAVALVPVVLQHGQRAVERLRAVDLQCVEAVEGLADRFEERMELGALGVLVLEAALGHPLHQPAPGVGLLAEEARVDHGQAQQRRLQRHDGFAHRHQQPRVLRHLVHQLAHHLQAEHLPDMGGLFLQLGAHQAARRGLGVRAPGFGIQRALAVDSPLRVQRGRRPLRGRRGLRPKLGQLLVDAGIVGLGQPGVMVDPVDQEVLVQTGADLQRSRTLCVAG